MSDLSTPAHAVVPIIMKQGCVLVIRRAPGVLLPGYWCPPSGRIEPGETQEQAVVREVEEELGIEVRSVVKVWECPTDDGDFILHWWIVEATRLHLRPDPTEIADLRWVTPEEFLALEQTFVGDRQFFRTIYPTLQHGIP
jgi:8-oxo-dGTP diphosphatase